jgi:hypothetical protein
LQLPNPDNNSKHCSHTRFSSHQALRPSEDS